VTALVDTACGYAALTTMADDREVLTVDFSANFVAPAAGEVHALAGAAEPRLVAAMQATMMAVVPPPAKPDVPAT
jgi:hypothetical protein